MNLALAILIPITFGLAGGLLAGDAATTWLPTLKQPRYALSLRLWIIVGVIYYVLCAAILYRLLTLPERPILPLALLLLLMAVNEVWNYVCLRRRNLRDGVVGMALFAALAVALFLALLPTDGLAALLLAPYLAWLVYDLIWIRALWRLNAA